MKTLTTAEMVSHLKMGQSAEMIEPVKDIVVVRTPNGIYVKRDASSMKHVGTPLPLTSVVMSAVWVLEPIKVDFFEALAHLRQGKKVSCVYDNCSPVYYESLDELIHLYEATDGKWFVEEE